MRKTLDNNKSPCLFCKKHLAGHDKRRCSVICERRLVYSKGLPWTHLPEVDFSDLLNIARKKRQTLILAPSVIRPSKVIKSITAKKPPLAIEENRNQQTTLERV